MVKSYRGTSLERACRILPSYNEEYFFITALCVGVGYCPHSEGRAVCFRFLKTI